MGHLIEFEPEQKPSRSPNGPNRQLPRLEYEEEDDIDDDVHSALNQSGAPWKGRDKLQSGKGQGRVAPPTHGATSQVMEGTHHSTLALSPVVPAPAAPRLSFLR